MRLALDLGGADGGEPVDGVARVGGVAVGHDEAAAGAALGAEPAVAGAGGGAAVGVGGEEGEGVLPDLVRERVPRGCGGAAGAAHRGGARGLAAGRLVRAGEVVGSHEKA